MTYSIEESCTVVLVAVILIFVGTGTALSKAPAAGTTIRNQASATYRGANGIQHSATSNQVITIVAQVYSLSISPNGQPALIQQAIPGNIMYYSFTLVNTGNGPDQYRFRASAVEGFSPNDIHIYADVNRNGLVDPGEPLLNSDLSDFNNAISTRSIDRSETLKIILSYSIPPGQHSGDSCQLRLEGQSVGNSDKTDIDNVTQTVIVNEAVLTGTKTVNVLQITPGGKLTFTIAGSNLGNKSARGRIMNSNTNIVLDLNDDGTGEAHEGILVTDVIPDNTKLQPDSVSGSPQNGFPVYFDPADQSWKSSVSQVEEEIRRVGFYFPDLDDGNGASEEVFVAGQQYQFTYTGIVGLSKASVVRGTSATTYWANSTGDSEMTDTNWVDVSISALHKVLIGPENQPGESGSKDVTGDGVIDHNDDVTLVDAGIPGSIVTFTNTIKNAGNSSVVINIKALPPSNWTVQLLRADGRTPLTDTNTDGVSDVGRLEPSNSVNIVVKAYISRNVLEEGDGSGTVHDIVLIASSSATPTTSNQTYNRVQDILSANVILGVNQEIQTSSSIFLQPGASMDLPMTIHNQSAISDSFKLNLREVPSSWNYNFYLDHNFDGVPEADTGITSFGPLGGARTTEAVSESSVLPVSNVDFFEVGDRIRLKSKDYRVEAVGEDSLTLDHGIVSLDANTVIGELAGIVVNLQAGEQTPPGPVQLSFHINSLTDSGSKDTLIQDIQVQTWIEVSLSPDHRGAYETGSPVSYVHQLCNRGNAVADISLGCSSQQNWNYNIVYGEGHQNNQAGDPVIDIDDDGIVEVPSLEGGECLELLVQAFVPTNAPVGQVETMVLGAGFECPDETSLVDFTRVVQGKLRLSTSVMPSSGQQMPGTKLTYQIEYTNLGSQKMEQVIIYDSIPPYTTFEERPNLPAGTYPNGSTVTSQAIYYSTDNGTTWISKSGFDEADSAVTSIKWVIGVVESGASGTVRLPVKINDHDVS